MKERTNPQFAWLMTYTMLFITAVAMGVGCNTSRRATTKVYKAANIDRIAAGKACVDLFPTSDSIITKVEYKEGKLRIDTFTHTEYEIVNDTVYVNRVNTVVSNRVDTVIRDTSRKLTNNAEVDYWRDQDRQHTLLADRQAQGKKNWRTAAISSIGLILLWVVVQVVKLWRKATVKI